MPWWLVAIIGRLGLRLAMKYIERNNPALAAVIRDILDWVDDQPDKKEAANKLAAHCDGLIGCPTDIKK